MTACSPCPSHCSDSLDRNTNTNTNTTLAAGHTDRNPQTLQLKTTWQCSILPSRPRLPILQRVARPAIPCLKIHCHPSKASTFLRRSSIRCWATASKRAARRRNCRLIREPLPKLVQPCCHVLRQPPALLRLHVLMHQLQLLFEMLNGTLERSRLAPG